MRTFHFLLTVLAVIFISACENPGIREFASTDDLIASLKPNEKIAWMLKVPSGTEVAAKNGIIHIQFPENVTAWCYNPTTETWTANTSLDYNCKCHSGNNKCTPYTAKGQVGCFTEINDPCSDCRGTIKTEKDPGIEPHSFSTIVYDHNNFNSFLILDSPNTALQKCHPATTDEINNPELTSHIFEWLNEIVEKHKNLYNNADFSNDQLPEGFGVVPFTISKNLGSNDLNDYSVAYLIVPQCVIEKEGLPELTQVRYFSNDDMVSDRVTSSKMSCSGTCAEGSCTLKSYAGGIVKGCEGCKSGCTLHIE